MPDVSLVRLPDPLPVITPQVYTATSPNLCATFTTGLSLFSGDGSPLGLG